MENEETENPGELAAVRENNADENPLSELDLPVWSVISFEKRVGKNLKYAQARELLEKFTGEKISGLCIITDEAAEKMSGE